MWCMSDAGRIDTFDITSWSYQGESNYYLKFDQNDNYLGTETLLDISTRIDDCANAGDPGETSIVPCYQHSFTGDFSGQNVHKVIFGGAIDVTWIDSITYSTVPIPSAVWLFGSGLIGLIGLARRKA